MGNKLHRVLVFLLTVVFLSACSENKPNSDSKKASDNETETVADQQESEKEEDDESAIEELLADLPKPTETVTELVNADAGEFSGKGFDELTPEEQKEAVERLRELPKLDENPSEQEIELYWRKSLSLFHEDYANPAEVLGILEVEAFGSPDIEDERFQFKDNLNVEILLDASGSMANQIDGRSMMDIAKESIKEFAESLPEGANIALRVYGHEGTGSDQDKELSCKSNELVYEMSSYDAEALGKSLNEFQPAGWTPLAKAIEEAKKDLSSYKSDTNTNIIYLVSDGVETCDGDPVAEAQSLADSNIKPIVNVIGFDLNAEGQNQLKEVAQAAKGIYSNARNQEQLNQELARAREIADKWTQWQKDAVTNASSQRYDQLLSDIPRFGIDWNEANRYEKSNIREPLRVLRDEGHISREAFQLLSDKTSERYSKVLDMNKQIREDLRSLANKNFESVKEEINKKYSENTN